MTLKKVHFSAIFPFWHPIWACNGHFWDKICLTVWIMPNYFSYSICLWHTVHFWALECSKNVHRECSFPLIISVIRNTKSLQMTFLQFFLNFFPNFPSVLLCEDPGTTNPQITLENWPKVGWGIKKVLKNLSPKIWDWMFWHLNLFFFQILNPNTVPKVKL